MKLPQIWKYLKYLLWQFIRRRSNKIDINVQLPLNEILLQIYQTSNCFLREEKKRQHALYELKSGSLDAIFNFDIQLKSKLEQA